MEIYKDLSNPVSQEFEKLLNSQLSKIQIEEGKIIEGKINKITEKFVFLFVEGLKSEPVLDVNELKSLEKEISFQEVLKSIKKRDKSDYNRKISPLKKTKDSVLLNTSKLTKRACFLKIKKIIDRKINT
mgnify:CR=1 FL=1